MAEPSGMFDSIGQSGPGLGDLWKMASVARGIYGAATADDASGVMGGLGTAATAGFGLAIDATSAFGDAAGPLGSAFGGAINTGHGLYDAYQGMDQIDEGGFFNDDGGRNAFWGGAGDATLGAAHTAISAGALLGPEAIPVVQALNMGLSVGEGLTSGAGFATGLAGDALDMVAGGDDRNWTFDAGDVVGGVEHGVASAGMSTFDAVQNSGASALAGGGIGAMIGGGVGAMATAATLGLASPLMPMLAATGGALGANIADKGIMGTAESLLGWF